MGWMSARAHVFAHCTDQDGWRAFVRTGGVDEIRPGTGVVQTTGCAPDERFSSNHLTASSSLMLAEHSSLSVAGSIDTLLSSIKTGGPVGIPFLSSVK